MNELPLPIWFFLLYPLCWIVLFPVLTLWSSLLCLAASRGSTGTAFPLSCPGALGCGWGCWPGSAMWGRQAAPCS